MIVKSPSLETILKYLNESDSAYRSIALKVLERHPRDCPQIAQRLQELLNDRAPCVTQQFDYCEVRLLAARAIVTLNAAFPKSLPPVSLKGFVRPLKARELVELSQQQGFRVQRGIKARLQAFEILQASGKLPVYSI